MIQRIQTLWLLLSAAAIFFVFKMPVAGGQRPDGSVLESFATSSLLMFIIAILLLLIPAITIFLFKNRPNQKRLIWLAILLDVVFLVLMYFQMEELKNTAINPGISRQTFKIGAVFPVLYIILMFLAFSGIRKDDKLIKSLDRLR